MKRETIPVADTVSDRRAGRLHQRRQVDAVQSHDASERVVGASTTSSSVARKAAISMVGRSEMKPTVSERIMRAQSTFRSSVVLQKRVDDIAASILDKSLQALILVRPDRARFVLVEGCIGWSPSKRLAKRPIVAFRCGSTECYHDAANAMVLPCRHDQYS